MNAAHDRKFSEVKKKKKTKSHEKDKLPEPNEKRDYIRNLNAQLKLKRPKKEKLFSLAEKPKNGEPNLPNFTKHFQREIDFHHQH